MPTYDFTFPSTAAGFPVSITENGVEVATTTVGALVARYTPITVEVDLPEGIYVGEATDPVYFSRDRAPGVLNVLASVAEDADDLTSEIGAALSASLAPLSRVATLPTAAASVAKVYDGARNTYNLRASHLLKIRAALGKAIGGTGLASIAALGTSIAAGQGALAGSTSYPVRLRQLFEAVGVPIAGTGNVLCHHGDTTADARWGFVGTWTKFNPGPTSRTVLYSSATTSATATFTADLPGTVVEVRYSNSSGPFTVAIDGGSAVTVTPAGGTAIATYTVSGLADTTHTVVATRTSGTLYLVGANVRKATGLQIHNVGLGGARANDLYLTQPYDARSLVRDVLIPDLCLVNVMTNEAYTEVSAATFKTNMTSMLTSLVNGGIPLVLIAEIPAGGTTTPTGNAMNLTAFRTALYELAITFDVPVIDLYERWGGTYAGANGVGMMFDTFHPNAAGYGDYASAIIQSIR